MTQPTNTCRGCKAPAHPGHLACRACWDAVPLDLRRALSATFVPERDRTPQQRSEHRIAAGRVHKWLVDHRRQVSA